MRKFFLILSGCFALSALQPAAAQAPDSLAVQEVVAWAPADEAVVAADTLAVTPEPAPPVKVVRPEDLLARADSLRRAYRFAEAVAACRQGLDLQPDSLLRGEIDAQLMSAQNGLNMLGYCSQPVVVARERFSREEFFLYYPLGDGRWRPLPNSLDSLGRGFPHAMYLPMDADELYYSAVDEDGIRNLYHTTWRDSLWSVPALLGEKLTSERDEIFPFLSADGRSLYFASEGLYGMGGFDLYVSRWNSERHEWDMPVNMGFPFSSPYDDFLLVNTPDGRYTMFASNRECGADSVYIYVLEYDSMPVRKALHGSDEVRTLSRLLPVDDPARMDNGAAARVPENTGIRRYMDKMEHVRALRDSIYHFGRSIDEARAALAGSAEPVRSQIAASIRSREAALPALQDALGRAVAELQEIEMDFLSSGVVIDPEQVSREADKKVVGAASAYTFTRNSMGIPLRLRVARPKPSFDYSFKILPEGRFAEDNTLPGGLVYQIQILSSGAKVGTRELKGLSPVFWRLSPQLRYTYAVGIFRTYADCLSHLNKVKKAGFRNAFIVAWKDGKALSVEAAKGLEKTERRLYQIRIETPDGQSLSETAVTTIHALTRSDLSRSTENGRPVYLLGPYDDRVEADQLLSSLKAAGVAGASVVAL